MLRKWFRRSLAMQRLPGSMQRLRGVKRRTKGSKDRSRLRTDRASQAPNSLSGRFAGQSKLRILPILPSGFFLIALFFLPAVANQNWGANQTDTPFLALMPLLSCTLKLFEDL